MTPDLPIFVISLARAEGRRAAMRARLDKAGLRYEIVDAIDGAGLDITPHIYRFHQRKFNRKFGRDMTPREVACYLSHYQLWERIANAKNHCALVLEDDADWDEDLATICEEIDSLPWPWGVVLLSARQSKVSGRVLEPHIGDNRRLILPDRRIATAAGYLISQWAARALLEHCREISAPLDIAYGEWWRSDIPFYVVSPSPVWQTGEPPLITQKQNNTPRLVERMTSALWQTSDAWLCRWRYLQTSAQKERGE